MPQTDLEDLARLVKGHFPEGEVGRVVPFVMYREKIDQLLILEENCSFTENPTGGNITLLEKNYGEDAGKIVGVVIHQWSQWKKNL